MAKQHQELDKDGIIHLLVGKTAGTFSVRPSNQQFEVNGSVEDAASCAIVQEDGRIHHFHWVYDLSSGKYHYFRDGDSDGDGNSESTINSVGSFGDLLLACSTRQASYEFQSHESHGMWTKKTMQTAAFYATDVGEKAASNKRSRSANTGENLQAVSGGLSNEDHHLATPVLTHQQGAESALVVEGVVGQDARSFEDENDVMSQGGVNTMEGLGLMDGCPEEQLEDSLWDD